MKNNSKSNKNPTPYNKEKKSRRSNNSDSTPTRGASKRDKTPEMKVLSQIRSSDGQQKKQRASKNSSSRGKPRESSSQSYTIQQDDYASIVMDQDYG